MNYKEFYAVPFYVSRTSMRELSYGGELAIYSTPLGIREAVTGDKIVVLHDEFILMHDDIPVVNDRWGRLNSMHDRALKKKGYQVYVKASDISKADKFHRLDLDYYFDNFEISDYNKFLNGMAKRRHEKINSKSMYY